MNVIILTPDRVGSTLLQRLITVYMLRRGFGRPVINLHELSNGLIRYYNTELNQEVLGKPDGTNWGYFQSLPEVVDLLRSVEHFKTSRLAQYHIMRRQDSLQDQLKFYQYLNENFFVISCRRQNLFDHAMSWAIYSHSKRLNVYSLHEKLYSFGDIYRDGIWVERLTVEKYLDRYKQYLDWSDTYFDVQSYFDYDHHIHDVESYILNLDFMRGAQDNSWADMFGIDFKTWNTCHRALPNLLLRDPSSVDSTLRLAVNQNSIDEHQWQQLRGPDWPQTWKDYENCDVPAEIRTEIETMFKFQSVPVTRTELDFFRNCLPAYKRTVQDLEQLQQIGFLVTGIPLKLQSLAEKKHIIRNFDQCIEWYNAWQQRTGLGQPYTMHDIEAQAQDEETRLNSAMHQQLHHSVNKVLSG